MKRLAFLATAALITSSMSVASAQNRRAPVHVERAPVHVEIRTNSTPVHVDRTPVHVTAPRRGYFQQARNELNEARGYLNQVRAETRYFQNNAVSRYLDSAQSELYLADRSLRHRGSFSYGQFRNHVAATRTNSTRALTAAEAYEREVYQSFSYASARLDRLESAFAYGATGYVGQDLAAAREDLHRAQSYLRSGRIVSAESSIDAAGYRLNSLETVATSYRPRVQSRPVHVGRTVYQY